MTSNSSGTTLRIVLPSMEAAKMIRLLQMKTVQKVMLQLKPLMILWK